jgi:hypothetical protein
MPGFWTAPPSVQGQEQVGRAELPGTKQLRGTQISAASTRSQDPVRNQEGHCSGLLPRQNCQPVPAPSRTCGHQLADSFALLPRSGCLHPILPPLRTFLNLAQFPGIIVLPAAIDRLLACCRVVAGEQHIPVAIFAMGKASKLIATVTAHFRRVGFLGAGAQQSYRFNIYFCTLRRVLPIFLTESNGRNKKRVDESRVVPRFEFVVLGRDEQVAWLSGPLPGTFRGLHLFFVLQSKEFMYRWR